MELLAACAFGLEAIVRRELEGLGIEAKIDGPGKVAFDGDWETIAKANLWLRCADRVLIRIARFPAPDFDALFDTTRDLNWADWIPADGEFPVTGQSIGSALTSVPAIQRSVKRAVVESLRTGHRCEGLSETGPTFRLHTSLLKDVATITLDTTGRSLHRRGYRTDVSRAPLKETLASALVYLSFWKPERPLADPFCGSGTIPIEAARLGRRMPPGMDRSHQFLSWPQMDASLWGDLVAEARSAILPHLPEKILGSDIDGRVLASARENARRAGVEADIHFERLPATEFRCRRRFGCLITNPPYGQRLQSGPERSQLENLYRQLPAVLAGLPTWSHYVLTAMPRFESLVSKTADRRRKLYNGRIECTYFQYHGPKPVVELRQDPSGVGQVRLVHADGDVAFGALDQKSQEQASLFASRLQKRARHLRRWPTRRRIGCYRVYERDVPEIPLVVDRYEDHLHVTEYERPHDRDPAMHAKWLQLMAKTAGETLGVQSANVHLKSRTRQKGLTQHEKVNHTDHSIIVHEGGLKFSVNLEDYVDTGLFLDHRNTREMVRAESSGKRVLNLFCYTGSFTVYAIDGGAASTTSVDLSPNYIRWATHNLSLNGQVGASHRLIASDVRAFLRDHPAGEHYDLVVLDPPTFSNSKRTERDWSVQADAVDLIRDLLPLVSPGGLVYFSTNFRRFKFDESQLSGVRIHEVSRQTVPEDFRNRRIHRCWKITKAAAADI